MVTTRFAVATLVAVMLGLVGLHFFAVSGRTIYRGGRILTMDGESRVVEALGIDGDRIAVVGSEAEAIAWGGPFARLLDLRGHALMPGFVDAHSHFPGSGIFAVFEDLHPPPMGDVARIADVVEHLRRHAAAGGRAWIVGMGYDDSLLAEGRHPTRADLDHVSTERPVAALHISGHVAVVNSRGLAELGYDARTPDPAGGRLRRDVSGELDGLLEERAMEPLTSHALTPGPLDAFRMMREGSRRYLAAGVTTAQNGNATLEQIRALTWASRLGLVPLRLVLWPTAEVADALMEGRATFPGAVDPAWVHVGAVKLFADGSIQTYTAYLTAPYHVPPGSDPTYRGSARMPRAELMERVATYYRDNVQVAIHGNGDAAIDDILDAVEEAQRIHPRRDARPIIVHAQMARDDQLDRMQRLGVVPSFFVLHTYYWGDRHRDRFLGPERAARISPAASAVRHGLRFTLHCDTPVVPMEPLRLVWAAVNRRSTSGAIIGADERIDVDRALRAVTIDAAWQGFEEDIKGSLEPGKLADLVVLSESPLDVAPERLDEIRVIETIVDGRSAYRAPEP